MVEVREVRKEATQAAEDIAQAAAIAADVALIVTSWTVFGTIGLGIAAVAESQAISVLIPSILM